MRSPLFLFSRNFFFIEKGVDTRPFLREIETHGKDVPQYQKPPAHREAKHIGLRRAVRIAGENVYHGNIRDTAPTARYALFSHTREWLEDFAKRHDAALERVQIAILKPQGKIFPHWDEGSYYLARERYHLVLQSEGSRLKIGGQSGLFHEGEVWWINNRRIHAFFNDSETTERIHLIFDLLPNSIIKRAVNFLFWCQTTLGHMLKIHVFRSITYSDA